MNIISIFERFPTYEDCIAHLEEARWPDGNPFCPYCGSRNTASSEKRHRCYDRKTGFPVLVGTIFHDTHLPLQKWFLAISLMLNAKKGLSALQLSRDLVERGGKVVAKAVLKKKMKGKDMRAFVRDWVHIDKAHLMTDEYTGYFGMSKIFPHSVIKHTMWYVDCDIHTNSIESSWSPLKRGMFGQFRIVSRRHLQRYVDEFCYRFNQRHQDPEKAFFGTINRGLGVA